MTSGHRGSSGGLEPETESRSNYSKRNLDDYLDKTSGNRAKAKASGLLTGKSLILVNSDSVQSQHHPHHHLHCHSHHQPRSGPAIGTDKVSACIARSKII